MKHPHKSKAAPARVLVVDVGGSNIKCMLTGRSGRHKIKSGPDLTPAVLLREVRRVTVGWHYDAVSVGFPAPVAHGFPMHEPTNLGRGWMGFDFHRLSDKPVRLINDAAMQALGSWEKGRTLFLGLGTGLGGAMVVEGVVIPLELCELRFSRGKSVEQAVCKATLKRVGLLRWQAAVRDVVELLQRTFLPEEIVIGGGNVKFLTKLPPNVRRGANSQAFLGGERLWETVPAPGGSRLRWQIA